MLKQYKEAKAAHPDMVLLFRVGDFYELFDADANIAAKVLGLTVTLRRPMKSAMDSGEGQGIVMAGFPHHSLEVHLRKLLNAGHRVAIMEQVQPNEVPKKAKINRIITKEE